MPSSEVPLISPSAGRRFVLDEAAMSEVRSAFLAAAQERGFIHQCTDLEALDVRLAGGTVTAYVGYDCTADSLHIGHLMSIMLLRLFQQHGNKPIVLMGGGTTRIGDPTGRDETRQLLSDDEIARNMAGIRKTFANFLEFDGAGAAVTVNNADWLDELRYIPLLRDIGRHFSVNRMLTQDSVKLRLDRDQPMTFLEFNYPILQAYDFVELARRLGCDLQMGGSDQWGNIVAGIELARRVDGRALFGQTMLPRDALARGVPAFELFVRAGLAASNSEARRLIKGGGARLNDSVVTGETQSVTLADLDAQGQIKLSAGRKRHALVFPG